jgi:hypothetical protein
MNQQPHARNTRCARRAAQRGPRTPPAPEPGHACVSAEAEDSLSDLDWVRLWAQIYRAEADALFAPNQHQ